MSVLSLEGQTSQWSSSFPSTKGNPLDKGLEEEWVQKRHREGGGSGRGELRKGPRVTGRGTGVRFEWTDMESIFLSIIKILTNPFFFGGRRNERWGCDPVKKEYRLD